MRASFLLPRFSRARNAVEGPLFDLTPAAHFATSCLSSSGHSMLCPANMLGYLSAIRRAAPVAPPSWRRFSQQEPNGKIAGWKPALQEHRASLTSFRAECPGPLPLREAPGHAVEESLFDCDLSSIDQTTMSIETFSPLPLNVFGTWITLLDPSDVPPRHVAQSRRRRFLSRRRAHAPGPRLAIPGRWRARRRSTG